MIPHTIRNPEHFQIGDTIMVFHGGKWRRATVTEGAWVRGVIGYNLGVLGEIGSAGYRWPLILQEREFEEIASDLLTFIAWLNNLEGIQKWEVLVAGILVAK